MIIRRNLLLNVVVATLIFGVAFLFITITLADTTSTLRPMADGGDDSASWDNTGGTACNTADCYIEVDESSGSDCTNSDGDTSYIQSAKTSGISQTFDLNESGITDDSTITQIAITVCHAKSGGGGTFQTRYCHNGSCSDSGTNISTGAAYAETTQNHTVSFTKTSGSDIEIGITNTAAKNTRISQISAVITYTLPADTTAPAAVTDLALSGATTSAIDLAWTAPGDDGSTGTATTYDVRYSTSTITTGNWSSATTVTGEPTPSVAGTSESMTVSGLSDNTTYYFAIKTSDEVPNESGLSNVPSLATSATPTPTPTPSGTPTPTPTPTPSGTPTPTPTPDPGDPDTATVVSSGGGGGNSPAQLVFSGEAYPGATLGIYLTGEDYGQVLINKEFKTDNNGKFYNDEAVSPVQEKRFYTLLLKDRDGRVAKSKSFTQTFKWNTIVTWENVIFPPMIKVDKKVLSRNELLLVTGYGSPGNKIEALIDGVAKGEDTVANDGTYRVLIDTNKIVLGNHVLRTRQVDNSSGKKSDASESFTIRISSFTFSNVDFNADDKVNIQDWSIFLSNWASKDESKRLEDDLNGDGKLDVSDLSVFLNSFQLSNR